MKILNLTSRPATFYRSLPKVDLHRHLEGSLRLRTLLEIGRQYGLELPGTGQLHELVQVNQGEPFTFENFLSKFKTLRLFYRSPEIIQRLTQEAIADAAADQVRYLELQFTPIALSRAESFPLREVFAWVTAAARAAEKEFGLKTRLIASVNRHEGPQIAGEVARLAADHSGEGIVGLSLAGDEANYSGLEFSGVLREAHQAGLHITIHAGEWGPARNVSEAIRYLYAERIGHGVRVLEDPAITALARERQIPFEVCLTSNFQSGVIRSLSAHPLARMLAEGLNVTLNTDDPSISQIDLSHEYRLACEELGLSLETLEQRLLAAAGAAFLPEEERRSLKASLAQELSQIPGPR